MIKCVMSIRNVLSSNGFALDKLGVPVTTGLAGIISACIANWIR